MNDAAVYVAALIFGIVGVVLGYKAAAAAWRKLCSTWRTWRK